jgi:hypothetical protein
MLGHLFPIVHGFNGSGLYFKDFVFKKEAAPKIVGS